jgi:hypothetical protein
MYQYSNCENIGYNIASKYRNKGEGYKKGRRSNM